MQRIIHCIRRKKEEITIKAKLLPILLSALILSSCVSVPIGDQSEVSTEPDKITIVITTPSEEASQVVSEQSGVIGATSEEQSTAEQSTVDQSGEESGIASENNTDFEYSIDIKPYLQYICPENAEEYLLLVNYDHRLTGEYAPADLAPTKWTRKDRDMVKLRKACEMALDAFLKEAALNGVTDVTVTSGYRSYTYQKWLFNYYVEQHQSKFSTREECEQYVMTFSCREGCSEHQTGLALDMHNLPAADEKFADTAAYAWLSANAHRFGFILRFPKDKEDITGISFEPWHYRFVGRDAATYIYEHGLCLEEYMSEIGPETAQEFVQAE